MHVGERVVASWSDDEAAPAVGWFAARQPGVVRFLEDRLGALSRTAQWSNDEVLAVALDAARAITAMFEAAHGVPPARVAPALLERAEEAVVREARGGLPGHALRQPALAEWLAALLSAPPVPLDRDQVRAATMALAAVIYALDEVTSGRAVP